MNKIRYIIVFLMMIPVAAAVGQVTELDRQLAMQYYANGDYEKAVMYLEKIYYEAPISSNYDYYYKTLLELNDLKEAEKVCKKQIKANEEELKLYIDLAKVYERGEKSDKAESLYRKAIDEINKGTTYTRILNLARAFQDEGRLENALEVYQAGNKYSASNHHTFTRNIAMIYGLQGKHQMMISTLLDLVHYNEGYLLQVQSTLNNAIDFTVEEDKVSLLKTELLKRSQKNPGKVVYNEMLAWLFTQKGDFQSAFIQIKALDKKEGLDGDRVLELAMTCLNNDEYDVAIDCYDYVISLGDAKKNYQRAKMYRLNALKKKLTLFGNASTQELHSLRDDYIASINQLGKNAFSLSIIRDLAHLYAYHLHDPASAQQLLEETLTMGGVKPFTKAEIKVELADVLVIMGTVWDASLYYSQVEKAYKHDALGHLAKFKNAKVFYYTGDFNWAQAQLDVLKASTSKLIANDAMELSMLITDNFNMDTTQVTMKRFAHADLLIFQNRFDEAQLIYDSINREFGYHTLNDEILMKRAEIEVRKGNFEAAANYWEEVATNYGDDLLCDNALFALGDVYENRLNDKEKAYEYYKKLIFDHPGSLFVVEARKRFRLLNESKGTHTIKFSDDGNEIKIDSIENN